MAVSPDQKLKTFFNLKPLVYKKGEIVLHFQDSFSGVFFLKKGFIKDSTVSVNGQEFTLFVFKPDDIFPYNWAFNKIPNEHSFTAITDCEVVKQGRDEFLDYIQKNPDVLFMLTQRILVRLRGLLQRMEYLVFGNASQKVASIFVILAERFGKKKNGIEISIPLSHKDIADLVGITRETASIEIKKLSDKGIIFTSSKTYIVRKPTKLLEESVLPQALS